MPPTRANQASKDAGPDAHWLFSDVDIFDKTLGAIEYNKCRCVFGQAALSSLSKHNPRYYLSLIAILLQTYAFADPLVNCTGYTISTGCHGVWAACFASTRKLI